MRCIVELSGEHDQLPLAELRAVLDVGGARLVATDGFVAIVEGADPAFLAARLALAHSVSAWWWSGAPERVRDAARPVEGTLAVRVRRMDGAHPSARTSDVARELGAAIGAPVDLAAPTSDVRVLLSAREAHVGLLLREVDRRALEARHVKHRAHFAPVSLHPRYARALVNLARVRDGDRVADPFCGTGGLMIEAGLVGARVYASDFDARMVAGTRATLEQMGVRGAVVEARDVGELPEFAGGGLRAEGGGTLDAVVSDPPYGRSSTTNQEELGTLWDRFYAASAAALKTGGRLAVIAPSPELRARAERHGFRMTEAYEQRVHKSMTRHWAVFVR